MNWDAFLNDLLLALFVTKPVEFGANPLDQEMSYLNDVPAPDIFHLTSIIVTGRLKSESES